MSRKKATQHRSSSSPTTATRWLLPAIIVVVLIGAAIVVLPTLNKPQTSPSGLPREVSIEQAVALRESGAFVLDVRQPDEWAEFHLAESTLIPLDELESRVGEVPRDRTVLVVCRSGNRSQAGRDVLLNAGFTEVVSMAGGLREWKALGYPTVTG